MNMVVDAANHFRHAVQATNGAAEIFMQARAPGGGDEGRAMFGGEDDVIMEAQVGGAHNVVLRGGENWEGRFWHASGVPTSFCTQTGGLAALDPRLMSST